jgi:hypothetical protein
MISDCGIQYPHQSLVTRPSLSQIASRELPLAEAARAYDHDKRAAGWTKAVLHPGESA